MPLNTFAQVSQNFLNDSQPVYEAGVGAITLNTPDYPGSDNNQLRVVPFPYLIYRGKFLRTDDEGTRARFLSSKYHEVGLSFGFNFPVKSSNNPSRSGMPDLDAVFGFGPRVLFRLITDNPNHRLNFAFATRLAFSSNFRSRLREEGLNFEPSFSYWYRFLKVGTTLFSNLSFEFGSAKLNRYFYNVNSTYSNSTRSTYLAKAGLIETALAIGFGQNVYRDDLFLFAGASWRNLNLAANKNSPLVASRDNLGVILGLVWTFYQSEEKVERVTNISIDL